MQARRPEGEWVVVESGRGRWRVLLPSPPLEPVDGRYARVGAAALDQLLPALRIPGPVDARPPTGRLLSRLAGLLAGKDLRRTPGRKSRRWWRR